MKQEKKDHKINNVEVAATIGLDWADQKHDICLVPTGSDELEISVIEHTPESISNWINLLRLRFGGQKIAICLEQSRGALIHALMKYDFLILYPINPQSLAKFRKTFFVSGAKNDPKDAELLWELGTKHRNKLRAWIPDNEVTRSLTLLVEARRKTVDFRVELSNKLTDELKGYFPQALDWAGKKISSIMACDFLIKWPTLKDIKTARKETLLKFYYSYGVRSETLINNRIKSIEKAIPLTTDAPIIETSVIVVRMLSKQLKIITESINQFDKRILALFSKHKDAFIFESLPGAGDALKPRLLAAMGSDRKRYDSAAEIQTLSGVAPVIIRSGKKSSTHFRWACPKFLRQTFHEYAIFSMRKSIWAKAYYDQQRAKGKNYHTAIRALAFKWIRIIYRCWMTHTAYDELTYIKALQKTNSPLLKYITNNEK